MSNNTPTDSSKVERRKLYWWKAVASFLFVLFMMPLGHALMIIMEHTMSETALHYSAFVMGAVGMVMVIIGVFAKGDTRQTLWGLFGGLLFWTGWVDYRRNALAKLSISTRQPSRLCNSSDSSAVNADGGS